MADFVAHTSRWNIVMMIVASASFVFFGLFMGGAIGEPPSFRYLPDWLVVPTGWVIVLFFGSCGIAATKQLFEDGEQLRIGRSGIYFKPWSKQTIPWPEIKDVTMWSYKSEKSIVLHLRDRTRFPGRGLLAMSAGANRMLTGGDIPISVGGTDRSFDEALAAIEIFRR